MRRMKIISWAIILLSNRWRMCNIASPRIVSMSLHWFRFYYFRLIRIGSNDNKNESSLRFSLFIFVALKLKLVLLVELLIARRRFTHNTKCYAFSAHFYAINLFDMHLWFFPFFVFFFCVFLFIEFDSLRLSAHK